MWKSLKRWPVLLALLVAVGLLALGLAWLPYGSRFTPENWERIKKGMTEAEVRAILGKPWDDSLLDPEGASPLDSLLDPQGPSDSDIDRVVAWTVLLPPDLRHDFAYNRFWISDNIGIFVALDDDGQVVSAVLVSRSDRPRSWLPGRVWRRLRERYGW